MTDSSIHYPPAPRRGRTRGWRRPWWGRRRTWGSPTTSCAAWRRRPWPLSRGWTQQSAGCEGEEVFEHLVISLNIFLRFMTFSVIWYDKHDCHISHACPRLCCTEIKVRSNQVQLQHDILALYVDWRAIFQVSFVSLDTNTWDTLTKDTLQGSVDTVIQKQYLSSGNWGKIWYFARLALLNVIGLWRPDSLTNLPGEHDGDDEPIDGDGLAEDDGDEVLRLDPGGCLTVSFRMSICVSAY